MLFVTTYCIYKTTSYIYLFNNCKEKCTFSTRPRVLRDQISREILVGIVIFLCLSKVYLSSFTWSKLSLYKLKRNSLYYVLNISYFIHFTSKISGQQCMGLEAALAWKTCTFGLTKKLACKQFHLQKLLNYTAIFGSFFIPNEQILVDKCPVCYQIMLSDYGKEEIIRSINLSLLMVFNVVNSWYTPPNSPFNIIVCNV